jgi:DNA polymerase-3 subunit delta'
VRFDTSTILIVNDIDESTAELLATLPTHDTRVIKNEEDGKKDFLIAHAKLAIKEAYIAANRTKYIIIAGDTFTLESQNSLLKVLEEPPTNIVFILVTTAKNSILPTIFSRMPHKYLKTKKVIKECELDISRMDLREVYNFLKENQRITKQEAKEFIESLLYKINREKIQLSTKELNSFTTAMKLCDLNSRPINILTTLLLNLMKKR